MTGADPEMAELTARMAAGEEPAFNVLYARYCDRLFRYLVVLSRGDETMARDLLQATWVKLARSGRVFHQEAHLWNWLTVVARHHQIDLIRRQARSVNVIPLDEAALNRGEEPEAEALDAALAKALGCGLGRLAADERGLVDGFYFEKLSQQVLADRSGTSVRGVESRLGRSRQKLRRFILEALRHEDTP